MDKVCTICKESLPETSFWPRKERGGRPRSKCKKCSVEYVRKSIRAWHLRTRYGITQEEYSKQLAKQNSKCAMCGTDNPRGRRNVFHIDHDAKSGSLRGLLCHNCNVGLGLYEKYKDLAEKYLSKNLW